MLNMEKQMQWNSFRGHKYDKGRRLKYQVITISYYNRLLDLLWESFCIGQGIVSRIGAVNLWRSV